MLPKWQEIQIQKSSKGRSPLRVILALEDHKRHIPPFGVYLPYTDKSGPLSLALQRPPLPLAAYGNAAGMGRSGGRGGMCHSHGIYHLYKRAIYNLFPPVFYKKRGPQNWEPQNCHTPLRGVCRWRQGRSGRSALGNCLGVLGEGGVSCPLCIVGMFICRPPYKPG